MLPALLAGMTATAIWGALFVVSKAVMVVVPPLTLLTIRLALALVGLAPVLFWQNAPWRLPRGMYLRTLSVGALGYGLALGMQFVGTDLSSAANGAVITATTPAFVAAFAAWLLREPLTRRRGLALVVATVGALLIARPDRMTLHPSRFAGDMLLLLSAAGWALYSVLVRALTRYIPVLTVSWWTFLGGLLAIVPFGVLEQMFRPMGRWTPAVWAGVLFLAWVATALAMVLWNFAFARLPAALAGLTLFVQPVTGTLLSAVFLRERPDGIFFLGFAAIALGLFLALQEGEAQPATPKSSPAP